MLRLIYLLPLICAFSFSQEITHEVYFDTDEYIVTKEEENRFSEFLSTLDTVDIDRILIYGFCDDRGTHNYNLWLSKKRANTIKWYFTDNEFSEDLITVLDGRGEIALADAGDIDEFRQGNRRVEIKVQVEGEHEDADDYEIPTTQNILKGELKVGDKVRLKNIYFKTGYSTIIPESIPTLKEIADILVQRKDIYFEIQGHVCCTHDTYDAVDRATNKRNLSISRAKFIYNYLLRKGVDKHRMKYVGLKRKFPLGGDPKFDRRVEIEITHITNNN